MGISGSIEPLSHGVTEQRVEAWEVPIRGQGRGLASRARTRAGVGTEQDPTEAREKLLSEMIEEASRRLIATDSDAQRDFIAYTMLSSLIRMAANPEVQHNA